MNGMRLQLILSTMSEEYRDSSVVEGPMSPWLRESVVAARAERGRLAHDHLSKIISDRQLCRVWSVDIPSLHARQKRNDETIIRESTQLVGVRQTSSTRHPGESVEKMIGYTFLLKIRAAFWRLSKAANHHTSLNCLV